VLNVLATVPSDAMPHYQLIPSFMCQLSHQSTGAGAALYICRWRPAVVPHLHNNNIQMQVTPYCRSRFYYTPYNPVLASM